MKEAFKPLGLVWGDIGRKGTDLNYMLSSLMFRHKDDVDYEEQNAFEEQARALHGLDVECEEARLQIKEANDDTKLDVDIQIHTLMYNVNALPITYKCISYSQLG